MATTVFVITGFNIEKNLLRSIAVCSDLQKAEALRLDYYTNPEYTNGFSYFDIQEHEIK